MHVKAEAHMQTRKTNSTAKSHQSSAPAAILHTEWTRDWRNVHNCSSMRSEVKEKEDDEDEE